MDANLKAGEEGSRNKTAFPLSFTLQKGIGLTKQEINKETPLRFNDRFRRVRRKRTLGDENSSIRELSLCENGKYSPSKQRTFSIQHLWTQKKLPETNPYVAQKIDVENFRFRFSSNHELKFKMKPRGKILIKKPDFKQELVKKDPGINLADMSKSIYSIDDNQEKVIRMEQSVIMMDFFNPPKDKLNLIEKGDELIANRFAKKEVVVHSPFKAAGYNYYYNSINNSNNDDNNRLMR